MSGDVADRNPDEDEDDWFGEGSAFDSGEDLASALFAIAGVSQPVALAEYPSEDTSGEEVVLPHVPVPMPPAFQRFSELRATSEPPRPAHSSSVSEWVTLESFASGVGVSPLAPRPAPPPVPTTWAVRDHESVKGGRQYGIRHGVRMLRMAEESMDHLRMDAIEVAWAAAAVAVAQSSGIRRGGAGD